MQNLTTLSSLASLCLTALVATGSAGCLADDGDGDGAQCLADPAPPLTLTIHGTAARGRPVIEKLPDAQCIEIEGPNAMCFFSGGAKEYKLTLRAEGYEPHEVKVTVPTSNVPCSGGYQSKSLEVALVESPSTT